ncbi:hypothetical protein OV203_20550 [Nannocystis sp. ILAH1]|uniref:hypothetical protein n=1 Tax=Nannocystis sp. ILAH1 TaxID=2996789 RepID=UPI00226DB9AE|nr:hypothetical protein [Nannocystis sp. ILAH1]MCY0989543.1 hypothetical protein [Nannocystis sp. ILAH1]
MQTVDGLQADEDGAPLILAGGQAALELGDADARTIVVTARPMTAAGYDPETRTPDTYPFELRVEPLP